MITNPVPIFQQQVTPEELQQLILNDLQHPVLFRDLLASWQFALTWSPQNICQLLSSRTSTFKLCPKRGTEAYRQQFQQNETVFETQCEHVEASFEDFEQWMESREQISGLEHEESVEQDSTSQPAKKAKPNSPNPLMTFPRSQYWLYADYKYMSQLCSDLVGAIDWSVLGFEGRDGTQSTLWVGSEEASTPCHYDTYGCNLVAQLSGVKRWLLFAPAETKKLYPTRVPYEESSVFSEVNIPFPNLTKHPLFKEVTGLEVWRQVLHASVRLCNAPGLCSYISLLLLPSFLQGTT